MTLKQRFWSKVNKHGPIHPVLNTRCWLWTAGIMSGGYGMFGVGRTTFLAHRMVWFLTHGKWPVPCALHRCDVRQCVRPSHLFEGTERDNACDARDKGRGVYPVGVNNGKARLTEEQVLAIRNAVGTQRQIAQAFGVTHSTVGIIKRHETWKHL